MAKKYTVEGSYQINDGEEKSFSIEYENAPELEEANNKLMSMLNKPLQLVKQGGAHGVKGAKRFFGVLALFAATNTILFFYSIRQSFATEFHMSSLLIVALVFILGVAATILASYRTYQYVIIDTLSVIYKNMSSFFQRFSEKIVDKVEDTFNGKVDLSESQLAKAVDYGKVVNSTFQKTPRVFRKGLMLVLNRIPVVGMLTDVKDDIASGNKGAASAKLYTSIDGFITESIFGSNNTKWVWWALPLNIVALLFLIHRYIG